MYFGQLPGDISSISIAARYFSSLFSAFSVIGISLTRHLPASSDQIQTAPR